MRFAPPERPARPRALPRDRGLDRTAAIRRDPYRYVSRRCEDLGTDVFVARLRLRPTIFLRGEAAASLFCDPTRFVRAGAPPNRVQESLFGKGGVQSLDDDAHRHRKALLMEVTSPPRVAALAGTLRLLWHAQLGLWASRPKIVLYDELPELLTRAVCQWAGVPVEERDLPRRARDLTAMFDAAGATGPRHWGARRARNRSERWATRIVDGIRRDRIRVAETSVAGLIAHHRGADGEPLPARVAAAELLNVLRPTVAVSVYLVHIAHALHEHRESHAALARGGDAAAERFVEEVRRHYPFFPAVTARVRQRFTWEGYEFPEGRRVLLDLYGTNHDPRTWSDPDRFDPERFGATPVSRHNFVPQGGGDAATGHRCPGEGITVALMKVGLDFLARRMAYDVPEQDLELDWRRLPALPRSRMVLANVRAAV
jgi:fatty-acid peroxygenase